MADKNRIKISFDTTANEKKFIEACAAQCNEKTGPFIINVLNSVLNFGPDARKDIAKYLVNYAEGLQIMAQNNKNDAEQWKIQTKSDANHCISLANYIAGKTEYKLNTQSLNGMKTVDLKNGTLIIPKDWLLIKPETAKEHCYAGVIECLNHEKYGVPHIVFFTDFAFTNMYTSEFLDEVNELACEVYPDFRKIMAMQVEPVFDSNNKGKMLNQKEYLDAPTIGHFFIADEGWWDAEPPSGAKIVRR